VKNRFLTATLRSLFLEGGSGVNGFEDRFAELRSFTAKNLRSKEKQP